ncbi:MULTISPECIES: hypothetical protein [Pseudoalteromonas]|uniref:hypothetical protein n=1 Tax=Pseudoalteromonas TaxID=53246 RepID=UPI0002CA35CA|nr:MULTISPECIES: hypothetical protein [Pseudoalteromonas]ENN98985.1 hypothetical protein J139_09433 [Pseudoalteromonas agarivorans S816]TMS65660.1 hypothetical protein CWB83_12555 [Pseudoalteromonas sp. S1691]TMS66009.1 hypothetical protein CWB86_18560 [Pseudoalteromonas sp. S1731]TMS71128.1 hypothetical protein CWB88_17145 [Pseudoalteromonas sp. S1941]TMS76172.1 hypothetical protein CWB82_17770 [Pseudoalteromonas sp. S1690]
MFNDDDVYDDDIYDDEPKIEQEYIDMINSGKYYSLDELCNGEGISYDELFMDEDDLEDLRRNNSEEEKDFNSTSGASLAGSVLGVVIAAGLTTTAKYAFKKFRDKKRHNKKS